VRTEEGREERRSVQGEEREEWREVEKEVKNATFSPHCGNQIPGQINSRFFSFFGIKQSFDSREQHNSTTAEQRLFTCPELQRPSSPSPPSTLGRCAIPGSRLEREVTRHARPQIAFPGPWLVSTRSRFCCPAVSCKGRWQMIGIPPTNVTCERGEALRALL